MVIVKRVEKKGDMGKTPSSWGFVSRKLRGGSRGSTPASIPVPKNMLEVESMPRGNANGPEACTGPHPVERLT